MAYKVYKDRDSWIAGRKKAFEAARLMITEGKSQKQVADITGSSQPSISNAMLIRTQLEQRPQVLMRLDETANGIRARTTFEQRKAVRRKATITDEYASALQFDAEIYQKLRVALDNITGLPLPKDTVAIVRKNKQRVEHTNRKLLAALQWIQEFSNESTS